VCACVSVRVPAFLCVPYWSQTPRAGSRGLTAEGGSVRGACGAFKDPPAIGSPRGLKTGGTLFFISRCKLHNNFLIEVKAMHNNYPLLHSAHARTRKTY
jgi:hypothetical protein